MKLKNFIIKHRLVLSLIFLGIGLRLVYIFFFNHLLDFTWHLAFGKSIADTGNITEGFLAILRKGDLSRLQGKLYYQIMAVWLFILDKIGIIKIQYLLDTKPFTDTFTYLNGLREWSPPLYQIVSIKLIQFIWDIPLVAFLYKIARLFQVKKPYYIVLFWALNPYLMMVGYAIFSTEIAMLSLFTGGVYFWLKSLKKQQINSINIDGVISIILIIQGAIIKQIPLLVVPFLLISFSKNLKSFLFYTFTTLISYYILLQPWSGDSKVFKRFFFLSSESTSIFNFSLNSISIFMFFYFLLIVIVYFNRKKIFNNLTNIVALITVIIALIYYCDGLFFIQHLTWILPFSALLGLIFIENSWLLLFALTAMTIKTINSGDYLSTLLSPTIGSLYSGYLGDATLMKNVFNYQIYNNVLRTFTMILIGFIGIFSLQKLFDNKNDFIKTISSELKFNYQKIVILTLIIYIALVLTDGIIKSKFILLPQHQFQISTENIPITKEPFVINVYNPQKRSINAVELIIERKGFTYDDNLVFNFKKDGENLLSQKVNAFDLPTNSENPFIIFLSKPVREKNFTVEIFQEKGINEIVTYKAKVLDEINTPRNHLYRGYDVPNQSELLSLDFHKNTIPLSFRGTYGIKEIIKGLRFHFNSKIKTIYYAIYLLFTVIVFGLSYILFRYKNLKFIANQTSQK